MATTAATLPVAAAGAATAAPASRDAVNPWVIAATVMLATFMEVLDTSVANVALPHIAGSMAASVDESTWVLTSYLVSNAVVLPMSGWLAAFFGRKRFYMFCVLLFTISSALCGIAPSLGMLILFRILQGLGGGALQPISQAILRESFPPAKQGMAMAIYGMGVVFAPVVGPTLGGWITDNFSWRWIFLINIPVGILSLLCTQMIIHDPPYLKEAQKVARRTGVDYVGIGLLAVGIGALEIFLDEGQRNDWFGSGFIVWSLAIAVTAIISLVVWELTSDNPVVDFRLLKDRNFAIGTAALFALGFVLYGSTMLLPLFLQTMLGYTATRSGLVLSPGGLALMAMMPVVGFLLSKTQPRWLVTAGLIIGAFGMVQMSRFNLGIDYSTAMWARVVQSIGFAFLFVPINTAALSFIPREKMGFATGLINLARNIGGSSGIALVGTVLARRSQFHQAMLASHTGAGDTELQTALRGAQQTFQQFGQNAVDAMHAAPALVYGMLQRQASMLAFADCFWLLGGLFVALIPLMLFLRSAGAAHSPVHIE